MMGGHLLANTVMQHTVRLEQTTFKVRVHCDAVFIFGCGYEYIVKVHPRAIPESVVNHMSTL